MTASECVHIRASEMHWSRCNNCEGPRKHRYGSRWPSGSGQLHILQGGCRWVRFPEFDLEISVRLRLFSSFDAALVLWFVRVPNTLLVRFFKTMSLPFTFRPAVNPCPVIPSDITVLTLQLSFLLVPVLRKLPSVQWSVIPESVCLGCRLNLVMYVTRKWHGPR